MMQLKSATFENSKITEQKFKTFSFYYCLLSTEFYFVVWNTETCVARLTLIIQCGISLPERLKFNWNAQSGGHF